MLYSYEAKVKEKHSPTPDTTLGLKYSVTHFYVDSTGYMADPPRWVADSEAKLKDMQRRLSRMEKGSNNYNQLNQKFLLLHEHIANQRMDYIHKETTRIANAWDAVCIRSSNMADMARKLKYANILDSGFGKFKFCLEYKLNRQGKRYVVVDAKETTTKICNSCGSLYDGLNMRKTVWVCPYCGAKLQREWNAARNIRDAGLAQLAEDIINSSVA